MRRMLAACYTVTDYSQLYACINLQYTQLYACITMWYTSANHAYKYTKLHKRMWARTEQSAPELWIAGLTSGTRCPRSQRPWLAHGTLGRPLSVLFCPAQFRVRRTGGGTLSPSTHTITDSRGKGFVRRSLNPSLVGAPESFQC